MKWQLVVTLLAFLAASVLASATQKVGGIEYVDSAAELPSRGARLGKGFSSFVSSHKPASTVDAAFDQVSLIQAAKAATAAAPAANVAKAPAVAGMDAFAAKHYNLGFSVGRFGRPDLQRNKKTKTMTEARLVEDCLACRFVWKSVQMDIGNSETQKTIYDSFVNQCKNGMKAPIMYAPCQQMFSKVDDMITGYAAGMTVDEVCAQAHMCR